MTATTMESFDAQMLDYQNDLDVPMHISSSDPWLQDVAPMEDDGHPVFQPKGAVTDTIPSIEVDMEAYVDEMHAEYEMLDDHPNQNLVSSELLDVDVLDASAVPSPHLTVTALPATPSVEHHPRTLPTGARSSAELSLPAPAPVLPEHGADGSLTNFSEDLIVGRTDINSSLGSAPLPERHTPTNNDTSEPIVSAPQVHEGGSNHEGTTQQPESAPNLSSQTGEGSGSYPGPSKSKEDQNDLHQDQQSTESVPDNNFHVEAPLQSDSTEPHLPVAEAEEHVPVFSGQLHPNDVVRVASSQGSFSDSAHSKHSAEQFNDVADDAITRERGTSVQPDEEPVKALDGVVNESSEEVHLDPPPPILLSIFSTEHPELCLFNKPTDPLPEEDDTQERHILFPQAVSLFYDPLAHLFEALRQDEYVSTVLEVSGNELALEAYELGLSITEDNHYGREISLHDICTLHTSANLHGALRLRLYVAGTRFIVRFHMLQEGLVNFPVDQAQGSEHDDSEHSQFDDQQDEESHEQDGVSQLVFNEQKYVEPPEDTQGPIEEGEHESTGINKISGDDDALGPAEAQTGEIDLSALPPFVDSPEVLEEIDQGVESEPIDETHPESIVPLEAVPNEDLAENLDELEDGLAFDVTGSTILTGAQENVPVLDGATSELQEEYSLEYSDDIDARAQKEVDVDAHENAEHDESSTTEQSEEYTEKTPQPDSTDLTNEAPTEPIECATTENTEDNQLEHTEGALDEQYLNNGPDAPVIEEFQDFGAGIWDDELDGEGEPDLTWEAEQDNGNESISNQSSATLTSKASKRSFDDYDLEHSDDENFASESPSPKRVRTE